MTRGQLEARDTTERLGPDDMATVHAEQHLEAARLEQQRAALRVQSEAGVCSNFRAACLPGTVYCDPDCRADHEARELVQRRKGVAR